MTIKTVLSRNKITIKAFSMGPGQTGTVQNSIECYNGMYILSIYKGFTCIGGKDDMIGKMWDSSCTFDVELCDFNIERVA